MSIVEPLTPAEILAFRAMLTPAVPETPEQQTAGVAGFIADVVPNQLITSQWGNSVRDDLPIRFQTIADRDLYWPAGSAPNGARCTTLSDHATWFHTGAAWVQQWNLVGAPYTAQAPVSHTAGTAGLDLFTVALPVRATPSLITVTAFAQFGFSGAAINATADIQRFSDGSTSTPVGPVQAVASIYNNIPVQWAFTVAANVDPAFKVRLYNIASSAAFYAGGSAITQQYILNPAAAAREVLGDLDLPEVTPNG